MSYRDHFSLLTGISAPHPWQSELASADGCESQLIRVPTGFGKTLGVLSAWTYHRVHLADDRWPRRLVWCLPMRVLVEQTEREVREGLTRLGLLWNGEEDHAGRVGVHQLMGGADSGDWQTHPEHCAVLIGTQDMLLSRALNRGYGAARGRWPMDLGLLSQDCLWVMDEVQLMDVGLATSGQLQSFRRDDQASERLLRPCSTWWMSATLQRSWLQKSPDTHAMASELQQVSIPPKSRTGLLWQDVRKPARSVPAREPKAIAQLVSQAHLEGGRGRDGPTLVVLNRVEHASDVFNALAKDKSIAGTDLRLAHSRFRPHERAGWRDTFLSRRACDPGTDRIIVATQVIEAGVDISAATLITQIAPWPSLVQRFGRAARWGGTAQVIIADFQPEDDKAAAPYTKESIDGARSALTQLTDVSPLQLEAFEDANPSLLPALYPYAPKHLLLRHELEELFDTTPDLSGADVDISRFIRSGDERDLHIFWQDIAENEHSPDGKIKPAHDALCAIPVFKARDWLCTDKSERLRAEMRAWVWDYLDGRWCRAERRTLYPGQTVLVAADCGGYNPLLGWSPRTKEPVSIVPAAEAPPEERADAAQDDESLSATPSWQTIAFHGREVGGEAASMACLLKSREQKLLNIACRWHDVGKVHEAFDNSIRHSDKPKRNDLAKAPTGAWVPRRDLYRDNSGRRRGGFRHELASTLALFDVLRRHNPEHPALLGPWRELLQMAGIARQQDIPSREPPNALEREVLALSAEDFDLVAYLVCCHHGKVRLTWHASPADQEAADSVLRIRGIRDGELLPSVLVATSTGEFIKLPASRLNLEASAAGLNPVTGRGWTERTLELLKRHGPFALAYLEALLRAADQRASRRAAADPLLATHESNPQPDTDERFDTRGAA